MADKFQFKRGTSAEWTASNVTLSEGEPGYETDTKKIKVGDGLTAWNSLAYAYQVVDPTVPSGFVAPFAGTSAPTGWLACDGSEVSRTTYADLFTAISTTWGVGDGSLTFNLPDLRGAFLRGTGAHGTEEDAGGTAFTGPAVGAYQDDQMQLLTGSVSWSGNYGMMRDAGTADGVYKKGAVTSNSQFTAVGTPGNELDFDSSGSPNARTSATTGGETRPFGAGVYYCIKI